MKIKLIKYGIRIFPFISWGIVGATKAISEGIFLFGLLLIGATPILFKISEFLED